MKYKHTQFSYLMLFVTLIVFVIFSKAYITALSEPPSYNSGPNPELTALLKS